MKVWGVFRGSSDECTYSSFELEQLFQEYADAEKFAQKCAEEYRLSCYDSTKEIIRENDEWTLSLNRDWIILHELEVK